MKPLTPPFRIDTGLLDPNEHAQLLAWALGNEARFAAAALAGGIVEPTIRTASSLRDLGPLEALIRDRIAMLVPNMIEQLRVSPFDTSEIELELAAHNDGAHFARHQDIYTGANHSPRGERMLSAIYYLHREPKHFSGGALRLHRIGASDDDPGIDIEPMQGRLVTFASWVPHQVMPVHVPSRAFADSRFAVNCWIYRQSTRVKPAG